METQTIIILAIIFVLLAALFMSMVVRVNLKTKRIKAELKEIGTYIQMAKTEENILRGNERLKKFESGIHGKKYEKEILSHTALVHAKLYYLSTKKINPKDENKL